MRTEGDKWPPEGKSFAVRLGVAVTASIIACALVMGAIFSFYLNNLDGLIRKENIGALTEISKHIAAEVGHTAEESFQRLEIAAQILDKEGGSALQSVNTVFVGKGFWNFSRLTFVDEKGRIADNGWSGAAYEELASCVSEGNTAMLPRFSIGRKEYVAFVRPVEKTNVRGHEVKALVGLYGKDSFEALLRLSAFDGQGYAHVVDREGNIVFRSSDSANQASYKIVNTMDFFAEYAVLEKGVTVEGVRQDFQEGRSGFLQFTVDGVSKYMAYLPIEGTGWMLITVVPAMVVDSQNQPFVRVTVVMCLLVSFLFGAILFSLVFIQMKNRKRLENIAYRDKVTGGYTLAYFERRAAQLLGESSRPYVLLYIDVDKFKLVNDREGREGGDRLLRLIYTHLRGMLRPEETVCRIAGDHYAMLLSCGGEEELEERLAEDMRREERRDEDYSKLQMGLTIGAYFIEDRTLDMTTMLDRANIARTADNFIQINQLVRFGVYNDEIRKGMLRDKELEEMMEEALEREEFEVYLQPKEDLRTGRTAGAEALVRWNSRRKGMIYPGEFIPLFERNGFITRLDLYMFDKVWALLARWKEEGRTLYPISVNLSRADFVLADFFAPYEKLMKDGSVSPAFIEFEFTETVLYDNVDGLAALIGRIHALGATCSMDDFGSSYSSLNMLKDADVDMLKLDQAFFRNAGETERGLKVVEGVVDMAHRLNVGTVAEGVEKQEQEDFLREIGCDLLQGYLFAKPMPVEQFERFTEAEQPSSGSYGDTFCCPTP